MTKLLHIQCSPRKARSASLEVAEGFIDRYTQKRPNTHVTNLRLWEMILPEFDEHAMEAKYAGLRGAALTADQQSAWNKIRHLATYMHKADLIVMSVPLWNFGIPYKLKQFIDLVSQKDVLFSFDPERGFDGLLQGKAAFVSFARGLDYSAQSHTPSERFDFQKPYVLAWLNFVGISDVHSVVVEKTLHGDQVDVLERGYATEMAVKIADAFGARG